MPDCHNTLKLQYLTFLRHKSSPRLFRKKRSPAIIVLTFQQHNSGTSVAYINIEVKMFKSLNKIISYLILSAVLLASPAFAEEKLNRDTLDICGSVDRYAGYFNIQAYIAFLMLNIETLLEKHSSKNKALDSRHSSPCQLAHELASIIIDENNRDPIVLKTVTMTDINFFGANELNALAGSIRSGLGYSENDRNLLNNSFEFGKNSPNELKELQSDILKYVDHYKKYIDHRKRGDQIILKLHNGAASVEFIPFSDAQKKKLIKESTQNINHLKKRLNELESSILVARGKQKENLENIQELTLKKLHSTEKFLRQVSRFKENKSIQREVVKYDPRLIRALISTYIVSNKCPAKQKDVFPESLLLDAFTEITSKITDIAKR